MNTLENDDGRSLDSLGDVCALVQGEVVCGDLGVFAGQQLLQLLVCQIEVEGVRVIEVVISSVLMLIVPSQQSFVRKISQIELLCQMSTYVRPL